jgi:hypothetical protein
MDHRKEFENFFQGLVRSLGGVVLDEAEEGRTADFKFIEDNVIAELKTMFVDTSDETNKKVVTVVGEWIRKNGRMPSGTIIEGNQVFYQLATIEPEIAQKWLNILRQYAERQVKDANAQIAETKVRESMPTARGVLFICNPNNTYHNDPESYRQLLGNILRKRRQDGSLRYPHIQGVVYFSTNEVKSAREDGYFWTPLQMQARPDEDISDIVAFQRKMRDGFYKYITDTLGIEIRQHQR